MGGGASKSINQRPILQPPAATPVRGREEADMLNIGLMTSKYCSQTDDFDPSEAQDEVRFYICPYCGPLEAFPNKAGLYEHNQVSQLLCIDLIVSEIV